MANRGHRWRGSGWYSRRRAEVVRALGIALIWQLPYSPELNPVERFFQEIRQIRRCVEGRVYEILATKKRAVEGAWKALLPITSKCND